MKMFSLLSCVSVVSASFTDVSGELKVTYSAKRVHIQGDLAGLPKSMTSAGIHVHSGTDCTNGDKIGNHLFSTFFDGWLKTTYSTDSDGFADINIKADGYALESANGIAGRPAVENRCIVMHGASTSDTASRVAIGQIKKDGLKYIAVMKKYPGPNPLKTNPAGKIEVIAEGNLLRLTGVVTNLGRSLEEVGIHIHTGTDCSGGTNLDSAAAVNAVVGGHLLYSADGFLQTKYASNSAGLGSISIKTPEGAYVLLKKDASKGTPVEDHCIVIHSDNERVGVGKIVCQGAVCKAKMGPYPKKVVPISGTLEVSFSNGVVTIKGLPRGLPRGRTDAGIHIHSGEGCTNNGYNDPVDISRHIGGHLYSQNIDGWAFPVPVTYNTNAAGVGTINVEARSHTLALADDTRDRPAVEGHCIVLHGASTSNLGSRVAIGKIVKNGDSFTADIGLYPGPNPLKTTPKGTITVTSPRRGVVALQGTITGLGINLNKAGIHIHAGTDCTGGDDLRTKLSVNNVIKGHLHSRDDGFAYTNYNTNINGEASIYVTTPANAYTLRKKDAIPNKVPSVEDRCIVFHDDANNGFKQVAIAQIKCKTASGSCAAKVVPYPKPVGPIRGELSVTYESGVVSIKGTLTGLFRDDKIEKSKAGIHVHEGTDCTDPDAVGNHLYSHSMDAWAPIKYDTNAEGSATILFDVKGHTLSKEDNSAATPAVEGHCIVLHGVSGTDMASRVAIGKIVKDGISFIATLGRYPGPNPLKTNPTGTISLTQKGDDTIQLASKTLKNLGKNLNQAGIHIHTGTDCTGGTDKSSKAAVNEVVGGHLLSRGDGFKGTTYQSNELTTGTIDIATPKGAYVLLEKNANAKLPAVENRCIVLHDADNKRVGVGKIVCGDGSCKAKMGPYPGPKTTTTTTTTTTTATTAAIKGTTTPPSATQKTDPPNSTTTAGDVVNDEDEDDVDAATEMFASLSALLICYFASF